MLGKCVIAGALGFLAAVALPALAADQTVSFGPGLTYSPGEVRIVAGEKVTFTPSPGHDFVATGGPTHHPLDFVDASIADEASDASSATRTFAQPGTYVFFCRNHGTADGSGMSGRVIVDAPPPPPPGTTTGTTGTTTADTTTTTSTSTSTSTLPPSVPIVSTDGAVLKVTLNQTAVKGLLRHPVVIRFTASEAGTASGSLTARGVVLARGTKTFKNGSTHALPLKITAAGRKILRRSPRLKGKLQITVRDVASNVAQVTRTVTVTG
jgi:plastocyanin